MFLGEKEKRKMTPRKMVGMYGLKHMCIAARPASRQSDGIFYVDPNSPTVLSNHFTAGIWKCD
jgi:hypothetical protein